MSQQDQPRHMLATELCDRCREETRRFQRSEPHDDGYCLEVIRRAIEQRDDHCWTALTAIYHEIVTHWCGRAGGSRDELEDFVSETWAKFFQSYSPERLSAGGSLSAALAYLKMCARSAVLDEGRRRARTQAHEESDPDDVHGTGAEVEPELAELDSDAFWALIAQHLHDERERLLVYLSYEIGLKPAEIYQLHPEQFSDVREVYKMRRNILDRLRRSGRLADWLDPNQD